MLGCGENAESAVVGIRGVDGAFIILTLLSSHVKTQIQVRRSMPCCGIQSEETVQIAGAVHSAVAGVPFYKLFKTKIPDSDTANSYMYLLLGWQLL